MDDETSAKYLAACEVFDALWARLHDRVGLCGHCGTRPCPGRIGNSVMPATIREDALRAAINAVLKDVRTTPPKDSDRG